MSGTNENMDELTEFNMLIAAVTLTASIARADGHIHPSELNIITEVLNKQFGIMSAAAPSMATAGLEADITEEDVIRHCQVFCENSSEEDKVKFMQILIGVANADLDLDVNESEYLKIIAKEFGLDIETLMQSES